MRRTWPLVAAFLLAVVLANVAVARWGQLALVFTAWVLIPLDMLTRDLLHERWQGPGLVARMLALVVAGGVLTAVLQREASAVAVASVGSFSAAMLVNALVFAQLGGRSRLVRMNVSNLAAAVVDSLLFPALAFGTVDLELSAAQAGSKAAGGMFWSALAVRLLEEHTRP